MFYGFELTDYGKIIQTTAVESVADAQKRLQLFQNKLDMYEIHQNGFANSATKNWFPNNYFHAILEASKSVLQRVREMELNLMERL